MKKFVILANHGTYEHKNGHMIIDCTVKSHSVYSESNDDTALWQEYMALKSKYENGLWTVYSFEKRATVRDILKRESH